MSGKRRFWRSEADRMIEENGKGYAVRLIGRQQDRKVMTRMTREELEQVVTDGRNMWIKKIRFRDWTAKEVEIVREMDAELKAMMRDLMDLEFVGERFPVRSVYGMDLVPLIPVESEFGWKDGFKPWLPEEVYVRFSVK